MSYTYILYSKKLDQFYIGYTSDSIQSRLDKHNRKHKGYTAKGQPWILVYSKEFKTKNEAIKFERQIKSWKSKQRIKDLIEQGG